MDTLQSTSKNLKNLLENITQDLSKADGGNKAAAQRVRTNTVRLEKIAKVYRKESINAEKNGRFKTNKSSKSKTTTKAKTSTKAKPAATKAKPQVKAAAKPAVKAAKLKTKPKAKTATARPRALSFKRPTARIPVKKR